MRAYQAEFRVATMARVLGVSSSGFYAWRRRRRSARSLSDDGLLRQVRAIHQRSRGTYDAPRIHAELMESGLCVGRNRIARLMREAGLAGLSRRRGLGTTRRDPQARPAPDLVNRRFTADAPDRLWLADITYVPTARGFLYLAIVLDAFSCRIVGWSMASNLRTELVLDALGMARSQRRPQGVVHHSDQGSQYTSLAFSRRCREAGVLPSMGKPRTVSTTPWQRASSPASNANSSTARPSATADTPGASSSATSKAGTTPIDHPRRPRAWRRAHPSRRAPERLARPGALSCAISWTRKASHEVLYSCLRWRAAIRAEKQRVRTPHLPARLAARCRQAGSWLVR